MQKSQVDREVTQRTRLGEKRRVLREKKIKLRERRRQLEGERKQSEGQSGQERVQMTQLRGKGARVGDHYIGTISCNQCPEYIHTLMYVYI